MDLTPYIAKGFPGGFDQALAGVSVVGLDREQTLGQVRLCSETEPVLYGSEFSPRRIQYISGTRPDIESIATSFGGEEVRSRAGEAMTWVYRNVAHPHIAGPLAPDRDLSEEQIIESGIGWCNEQVRVFIALCEVMELPARICFLFHRNGVTGHTAAEVLVDGRWAFMDVTFNVWVVLTDGQLAEGRDLSGSCRDLAHQAYGPALREHYEYVRPFVEESPGWRKSDRPDPDRGGDLLDTLGICNYLIDGTRAL